MHVYKMLDDEAADVVFESVESEGNTRDPTEVALRKRTRARHLAVAGAWRSVKVGKKFSIFEH